MEEGKGRVNYIKSRDAKKKKNGKENTMEQRSRKWAKMEKKEEEERERTAEREREVEKGNIEDEVRKQLECTIVHTCISNYSR
ncbi:hypothetical protein PRIPAC_97393 [Pristionchus pacificus]|uniref:Uncharacterized protein n=1 Tax=Pristionchus pacificus TaxID=54126 RepID=A0A2A6BJN9_PRIPA|nr:hypothetical protein PRIPAC_97393 [Pristionchus pacificus]|eukprot:PDM66134.1 hypothetical protein PRIPAC_45359 [Pristionchus pacificus]